MNHGVIEQVGTPAEVYDDPATLFVADFIGSPPMNILAIEAAEASHVTVAGSPVAIRPLAPAPSGSRVLGVRPEDVRFDDGSGLRGGVVATEYLGTTQIVTVDTGAGRLRARLPAAVRAAVGEQVGLSLDPARLSVFDEATGRVLARVPVHG